jgi:hypothetical protein
MKRSLSLILVLTILGSTPVELAHATGAKSCGKVLTAQNGNPYPILCSNGSPNSNAKKVLTTLAPRVMALAKSSTATSLILALCGDMKRSSIAIETSAYTYQFASYNWAGVFVSPDGLSTIISKLDPSCSATSTVATISVPTFVGHSMAQVDAWKRQSAPQVYIWYSTATGYQYSVSCQMARQGTVLSQSLPSGILVKNSGTTIIHITVDC